jgi:hypothetical protein
VVSHLIRPTRLASRNKVMPLSVLLLWAQGSELGVAKDMDRDVYIDHRGIHVQSFVYYANTLWETEVRDVR